MKSLMHSNKNCSIKRLVLGLKAKSFDKIKSPAVLILSFFVFVLFNIPSIKILFPSILVNIVSFLAIWSLGLYSFLTYKQDIIIPRPILYFVGLFVTFWIVMFLVSWIQSPEFLYHRNILQYLMIIFCVIGISLFVHFIKLKYILTFQMIWGISLALIQIVVGIDYNRELGQHYLTIGVPVALTAVIIFSLLFFKKTRLLNKVWLLFSLVILLYALTTLLGRSPVLLFFITVLCSLVIQISNKNFSLKKSRIITFIALIVSLIFFVLTQVGSGWLNRFLRMFTFEEEPRTYIYLTTIELIKQSPLGNGLSSMPQFGFIYPHNILLETLYSGGIIAFIFFIVLLSIYFINLWRSAIIHPHLFAFSLATFYIFLTWNLSFSLTSSYIPFGMIGLLIACNHKYQRYKVL